MDSWPNKTRHCKRNRHLDGKDAAPDSQRFISGEQTCSVPEGDSGKEINNRDIGEIPHPFIIESLEKFKGLTDMEKSKIIFIHFNHTNALINKNNKERLSYEKLGFRFAKEGDIFSLD